MSHECYMNVTFRFCWFTPSNSLKLPVFKGVFTDLGSHSFLHISFYPLYITRYNSRLMSLSKTKATRRSPCYGEERLFLAFLGCWLGRLFRRSLLLVGTLVELGCNHDDSGVLHAILVCPLLWLEETLDGEQRALGELVE